MSHDAGHGHAPEAPHAAGDHGPAVLPPAPATRSISPAPEDYERPFPGPGLLWPLVWLVLAIVLWKGADRSTGTVVTHDGHPATGGATGHE
jgi:hypothetical protein